MEMSQQLQCNICGTQRQLLRCARCKTVHYCSAAHQEMDWPQHKSQCRLLAKQKNNNRLLLQHQQQQQHFSNNFQSTLLPLQSSLITSTDTQQCWQSNLLDDNADFLQQLNFNNFEPSINGLQTSSFETQQQQQQHYIDSQQQKQQQPQFCYEQTPTQSQFPPPFAISDPHTNQLEKSSSYQILYRDENNINNVNEQRYEDLCQTIIQDMNKYGLSVVDNFLGSEKGLQILNEVHSMHAAGVFKDGQLVSANSIDAERHIRAIRGDKITWVKGTEPGCANVGYLINQIDHVITKANTIHNNGQLGQYNIKERTKAMVACYPGSGSHYKVHVDNPNKDGRVITAIYYLNRNWDTQNSGGVLRIFPEKGNSVADIEPNFDRLIFFWSDKRNPHEVQPAHRTRYAITVWYFDAIEREMALIRTKYQNSLRNSTSNSGNNVNLPNAQTASGICT